MLINNNINTTFDESRLELEQSITIQADETRRLSQDVNNPLTLTKYNIAQNQERKRSAKATKSIFDN